MSGSDPLEAFRGLTGLEPDEGSPRELLRAIQEAVQRFLLEYKFGLDEVLTKITILREEFEHSHDYSPIEHVKSRLKSISSLGDKLERTGCPPDLGIIRERIRDIAGIRVTCSFTEDTYRFAEMLTAQPDLTVLATKDYIRDPKPNGYRSLHLIVEVPVFLSDRTAKVPVEVQIRTIAMDFWASVEHQIFYKYDGKVPDDLTDTLLSVAATANALDDQMGRLRSEVRSLGEDA
ncbi:GTP pyrophosphokinase [Mumia flava]|nr:GTP pyrophosphokinase family protein [Mumia flava]